MSSEFIELHDSDVESVQIENRIEATIDMKVLIHKSDGIAGRDPGTEWMQHARLTSKEIWAHSHIYSEERSIIDGILVLGEKAYPNEMPTSISHSGYFYLSLIYGDGGSFAISGKGLYLALLGELSFLQEFE